MNLYILNIFVFLSALLNSQWVLACPILDSHAPGIGSNWSCVSDSGESFEMVVFQAPVQDGVLYYFTATNSLNQSSSQSILADGKKHEISESSGVFRGIYATTCTDTALNIYEKGNLTGSAATPFSQSITIVRKGNSLLQRTHLELDLGPYGVQVMDGSLNCSLEF